MNYNIISEQFTVKAHPAFIWGEGVGRGVGMGAKKGDTIIPVYIHIQKPAAMCSVATKLRSL